MPPMLHDSKYSPLASMPPAAGRIDIPIVEPGIKLSQTNKIEGTKLSTHLSGGPQVGAGVAAHDRKRDRGGRKVLSRQGSFCDTRSISAKRWRELYIGFEKFTRRNNGYFSEWI